MHEKQVKSVLNKQKQRDSWFLTDYSVNAYEGCSCNCLYCYVRGSKYGENMDSGLAVKSNSLEVLEKQLRVKAKKGQYGIVVVGSATDAYLHYEERWRLTEGMLKLFLKYRFPVFISTKSKLILRDIELLKQIDKAAILPEDLKTSLGRGVILSTSISSMDERIAQMLEPGAAAPVERLEVLQQLKQQGFLSGVNAIPILPWISDTEEELEKIRLDKERDIRYDYEEIFSRIEVFRFITIYITDECVGQLHVASHELDQQEQHCKMVSLYLLDHRIQGREVILKLQNYQSKN